MDSQKNLIPSHNILVIIIRLSTRTHKLDVCPYNNNCLYKL